VSDGCLPQQQPTEAKIGRHLFRFPFMINGENFMAASSRSSELIEKFSQYQPENMAEIIEVLAGGKDNLKVDVQKLRFTVGKQKFEVSGEVNFNVIHKDPLAHVKPRER